MPTNTNNNFKTYLNLTIRDINQLQQDIMHYVSYWVRKEKTPISQKEILSEMLKNGKKNCTVINALKALQKKGYIRRSQITKRTFYIQLKSI